MTVEDDDRETLCLLNTALNGIESLAAVGQDVLPEHHEAVLQLVTTLRNVYRHIRESMDVMIGCGEYHDIPFNIDAQLDHALWYLMTYVQEGKWDHSNPIMTSAYNTCTFAITELISQ